MKKTLIYLIFLGLCSATPFTLQARGGNVDIIEELKKHFENYGDLTIRSQEGAHTLDILSYLKKMQEGYYTNTLPEIIPSFDVSTDSEKAILIWLRHKLDNLKKSLKEQKQTRDLCQYQKRMLFIKYSNMLLQFLALYCHKFYPDSKNATLALQICNVNLSFINTIINVSAISPISLSDFIAGYITPIRPARDLYFLSENLDIKDFSIISFFDLSIQCQTVKYANFSSLGNILYNFLSSCQIPWTYSIYNRKNIALKPNTQLVALGIKAFDIALTLYLLRKSQNNSEKNKKEILKQQNISSLIARIEPYQRRVFDKSLTQSLSGRYDLIFKNPENSFEPPLDVRGRVWDINEDVSGIIAQYKSDKASIIRVKDIMKANKKSRSRSMSQKIGSWLINFVLLSRLGIV